MSQNSTTFTSLLQQARGALNELDKFLEDIENGSVPTQPAAQETHGTRANKPGDVADDLLTAMEDAAGEVMDAAGQVASSAVRLFTALAAGVRAAQSTYRESD